MNKTEGGIGFCGLLCLIFITLKLCNVIDWSWLWVLAPLWVPIIGACVVALISCIILLIFNNKKL